MKRLFGLIIGLLFASSAFANPFKKVEHFIVTHKQFTIAAATLTATSIVEYKSVSYCQRGDVERCIEGYGSRRAFNWLMIGVGGAMLGAAEDCWKNDGGKFCYVLAYGVPAAQVSFAIHDYTHYRPEHDNVFIHAPRPIL